MIKVKLNGLFPVGALSCPARGQCAIDCYGNEYQVLGPAKTGGYRLLEARKGATIVQGLVVESFYEYTAGQRREILRAGNFIANSLGYFADLDENFFDECIDFSMFKHNPSESRPIVPASMQVFAMLGL